MKRIFLAAVLTAAAALTPGTAAANQPTFEVGYTSMTTTGVKCSSGTSIDVVATLPTGWHARIAGYRIQNQDAADSVWLGGISVSTQTSPTVSGNLGEQITALGSAAYHLGYGTQPGLPRQRIYCLAADAAGAAGVVVSVAWFGY